MQDAVAITAQPLEIAGNLAAALGKAEQHGIGEFARQRPPVRALLPGRRTPSEPDEDAPDPEPLPATAEAT